MANSGGGTKEIWGGVISPFGSCSRVFAGACTGGSSDQQDRVTAPSQDREKPPSLAEDINSLRNLKERVNDPRYDKQKLITLGALIQGVSSYEAQGKMGQLPAELQNLRAFKDQYRAYANDFLDQSIQALNTVSSAPQDVRDRYSTYTQAYHAMRFMNDHGLQSIDTSMSRLGTHRDAYMADYAQVAQLQGQHVASEITVGMKSGSLDPLTGIGKILQFTETQGVIALAHPERASQIERDTENMLNSWKKPVTPFELSTKPSGPSKP